MKVVHILYELMFSGAEIMYVDAAPLFQNKGCDLTVVATATKLGEYAPYFEKAGYEVFHKPYPKLSHYLERVKYYRNFILFLKKGDYDVVHIHSHGAMWGLSLCAWLAGKKSVFTFHNVFTSHNYSYIYHFLLRWSAKNIFKCKFQTISDSVYEHEMKMYRNETTKIFNWYSHERFFPALEGEKVMFRHELGIADDAIVLISIGGCSHIKRHSDVIKALQHLKESYPNVLYLHLGKGETEADEIDLAKELGVYENIRFCGNQSDVRKYLIASDIYLMTSKFEGISITTIEAMACNVPTILYNVPGLRDFNKEMDVSILIESDYKMLVDNIVYLILNPFIASELSKKANILVNDKFYMMKNVDSIINLYQ